MNPLFPQERPLEQSAPFVQAMIDAQISNIAVLNDQGVIVMVNTAWRHFAQANGLAHPEAAIGLNYVEICSAGQHEDGLLIAAVITDILDGKTDKFSLRYACHTPTEKRWFVVHITRVLLEGRAWVMTTHENITELIAVGTALREQDQLLRSAVENIPGVVAIYDAEGRYRYLNERGRRYLPQENFQFIGFSDDQLFSPAQTIHYLPLLKRALATHQTQREEISSGDSSSLVTYIPLFDEQDRLSSVLGLSFDITEQKQMARAEHEQRIMAEALRDITAALTESLNPTVVMTRILETVGRVVPHDAAAIMLIEGDQGRVAYHLGFDVLVQKHLNHYRFPLTQPMLWRMLETSAPFIVSDTTLEGDWIGLPETRWIQSTLAVPIRSHHAVIGFLILDSRTAASFTALQGERLMAFADQAALAYENAQLYDHTQRYTSELEGRIHERTAELQRAKEHVEAILNNSTDAIVSLNGQGAIRQVNLAFTQLLGYSADDVFGETLVSLFHFEFADEFRNALQQVCEQGEPARLESMVKAYNGALVDVEVTLALVNPAEKRLVCNLRDITERKRMIRELQNALQRERELSELKSRFVSMASHEFRTPLAVILSSNDLLQKFNLDEEKRQRHFKKIEKSVLQMTDLLTDVLSISRAEAGHIEFNPVPLEFAEFCEDVLQEYRSLHQSTHQFVIESDCQKCQLAADPRHLRRIVSNLLSNAVKYSPKGGTIHITLERDQDMALLRVRDEGVGIPEADLPHIFETFHRASNVTNISGTGLGLTLVKQAVDLHRGQIEVQSVPNQGTTFVIKLPLQG